MRAKLGVEIHPTAVVSQSAEFGADVVVGPHCVIGDGVQLGDRTHLDSYVRIHTNTRLGQDNRVQAFTSLGGDPEDLKFRGEPSVLRIGDHNDIREHVTINRGTEGGGALTQIGNHCLLQNKVHVGHDCIIGDHVIVSALTGLAGHVELEDLCIVGGGSLVHQFCRVGTGSMLGFGSSLARSVAPYCIFDGVRGAVQGANIVGLRRRGADNATIGAVSAAIALLYQDDGTLQDRASSLLDAQDSPPSQVIEIAEFVLNRLGKRGLVRGQVAG